MARLNSRTRKRPKLGRLGPEFQPYSLLDTVANVAGDVAHAVGGVIHDVGHAASQAADTVANVGEDVAGKTYRAVGGPTTSSGSTGSPGRPTQSTLVHLTSPLSGSLTPGTPAGLSSTIGRLLTPAGALQALLGATEVDGKPLTPAAELREKLSPSLLKQPDPLGRKTLGDVSLPELMHAQQAGSTRVTPAGVITTPGPRRALHDLRSAEHDVRASTGPLPGLSLPASNVARTVFRRGIRADATPKELLAAAETGLVESGFSNLPYGDADSEGWRQERTSQYGTGPTGARNVPASADRFFQESVADTGGTRGAGLTAGQLAQTIQGSAYPERYDQVKPQASQLLSAFQRGVGTDPQTQQNLKVAKHNARQEGINPVKFNGDVAGGGSGFTVVRADAKGMVHWAESALGTPEGSAKQARWAGNFGLSQTQPWCANFISNGLTRRGISDLPSNPNYVPSYEQEWGKYAVPASKAKPGDLVTFNGSHIGVYVGNGEMVSGNSSDSVSRTPVGTPSMVIRPPYKGGKARIADQQVIGGSLGSALGAGGVGIGGAVPAGAAGATSRPSVAPSLTSLTAPLSAGPVLPAAYQGAVESDPHASAAAETLEALLGEETPGRGTRRALL